MSDIVLRGGTVVDGSGAKAFRADVAVTGGRIEAIGGDIALGAGRTWDVGGLVVAPGFIDCHSHSDLDVLRDPSAAPKVSQGVTTEVIGNCGFAAFPVLNQEAKDNMASILAGSSGGRADFFVSLSDYRAAFTGKNAAVNIAALAGHGAIRTSVMGGDPRPATPTELDRMRALVDDAMRSGATGLSYGLLYAPGRFAPREELVELGRVVASHGRPLVFHMRNELNHLWESIEEVLDIGRQAGARVHISHLKVADPANWGRAGKALAMLGEARARGQTVTCDQYPYTAGSSVMQTLLPPWVVAGGSNEMLERLHDPAARARMAAELSGAAEVPGWDNASLRIGWNRVAVGSAPGMEKWEGKLVSEIAAETGTSPADILFDLIAASRGSALGVWHMMHEDDVRAVMAHPAQMVGSDGLPSPGRPHPRLWGTFPRILGHYSREIGLLSIEDAVHRMTGKPAQAFRLLGRGLLKPGCCADICVFDPERVTDRATYDNPTLPPEGIVHVLCNGTPTMLDGARTGNLPGAFLAPS